MLVVVEQAVMHRHTSIFVQGIFRGCEHGGNIELGEVKKGCEFREVKKGCGH